MRYFDDYQAAKIPTFPSTYGFHSPASRLPSQRHRWLPCPSAAAGSPDRHAMGLCPASGGTLRGLFLLAVASVFRPTERVNFGLFKYASLYHAERDDLIII